MAAVVTLGACEPSGTVGVPSIARVRVTLERPSVAVGDSVRVIGEAFGNSGGLVLHRRRVVQFTSADPSVATVTGSGVNGVVRGVRVGTTYIVGQSQGERDSALVRVTPAP